MFKDKNLRKAFAKLVEELGGETTECLYEFGGVYGIEKIQRKCNCSHFVFESENQREIKMLLDHLNLEFFEGKELRKKSK